MSEQLDLEPIKARERAATKGPWKAKKTADGRCDGIVPDYHNHAGEDCYDYARDDFKMCPATDEIVTTDSGVYGPSWPDAEFIAHARTDIPALIAEIERLRAQQEHG